MATDQNIRCSKGNLPTGIEVKGSGGYIVVPPSKRKGRSYTVYRDIDPVAAPAWLIGLIVRREKNQTSSADPQPEDLQADPALVAAALEIIPNDDLDWEEWNRRGMAAWAATSGCDEGFKAFDKWSVKSSKYNAFETRKRWKHYFQSPPTRIGAGTLIHLADQSDPEWRNRFNADAIERGRIFAETYWPRDKPGTAIPRFAPSRVQPIPMRQQRSLAEERAATETILRSFLTKVRRDA